MMILPRLLSALAFTVIVVGKTQAATIDFGNAAGNFPTYSEDGYSFTTARLVNGNCLTGACLALNKQEKSVMTFSGGAFTLESISFQPQGAFSALAVFDTNHQSNAALLWISNAHNSYQTISFGNAFANVTSITFAAYGVGNLRIDNINTITATNHHNGPGCPVNEVPVPAAGWLLGSSLIGLAGWARKRKIA